MVIIVDLDGEVKSVPAAISQGDSLHEVSIVAPFTTSTCVLKIKPPSEEWLADNLTVANTTSDGKGVIFTTEIPPSVTELPGRLLYQLEFTGQDATVKRTKVGSISVSPAVLTDIPESAEDLSQYSLNQIYEMLASVSNNIRGFRKTIGLMKTAIPVVVTIPPSYWAADKTAYVPVEEVKEDDIVVVSFNPSQYDAFSAAEIICIDKTNGAITLSCSEIPTENIDVQLLLFSQVEISEDTESGGGGGEEEETPPGEDVTPDIPAITLDKPIISISGDTLSISPVTNATRYDVTAGSTVIYSGTLTALNIRDHLAENSFVTGSYVIRARAVYVSGSTTVQSELSNSILYAYAVDNIEPYLNAPVITINGDTLTLTPQGGNVYVDNYVLCADNVVVTYFSATSLNVKEALKNSTFKDFEYGTYSITCRAINTGLELVSNHSNAIRYAYEEPYVYAPTISINGDNIIITQSATQGSVAVEQYQLIVGGDHYGYYSPTETKISLSSLGLSPGNYDIWIFARNDEAGADPVKSNTVRYTVGMTVTLTLLDRSYMNMEMWYYINKNHAYVGGEAYRDGVWDTAKKISLVLNEADVVMLCNSDNMVFPDLESTSNCSVSELSASDGRKYFRVSGFSSRNASVEIRFT